MLTHIHKIADNRNNNFFKKKTLFAPHSI